MVVSITDYLIEKESIDWPDVLSEWSWLLLPELTVWLVNRFGDLFIVPPDATVQMLNVVVGTLTKVAENRDDFRAKIDVGDNAAEWLMIPMVDRMTAAGIRLEPGQCYGFKIPPILGGTFTVENVAPISIRDYLGAYGSIHKQLQGVPDGTRVILKVVHLPS